MIFFRPYHIRMTWRTTVRGWTRGWFPCCGGWTWWMTCGAGRGSWSLRPRGGPLPCGSSSCPGGSGSLTGCWLDNGGGRWQISVCSCSCTGSDNSTIKSLYELITWHSFKVALSNRPFYVYFYLNTSFTCSGLIPSVSYFIIIITPINKIFMLIFFNHYLQ